MDIFTIIAIVWVLLATYTIWSVRRFSDIKVGNLVFTILFAPLAFLLVFFLDFGDFYNHYLKGFWNYKVISRRK